MKKISVCILVCFVMALSGCSPKIEVFNYDFPLDKADIDVVLAEQELPWTAVDETVLREGGKSYFIADSDGKYRLSMDSTKTESLKMMYVNLLKKRTFKGGTVNNIIEDVVLEDQVKVLGLATKMYGSDIDYNKLYEDAVKSLEARVMDYGGYYFKKYDDIYVTLVFSFDEITKGYTLYQIELSNEIAYEANIESRALGIEQYGFKDVISKENLSVAEIKSFMNEDYKGKIKGTINNIKALSVKEAEGIMDMELDGEVRDIESLDYVKATLVDDSGEIDVLVRSSVLSEDDLAKERVHYFYYNKNNQIPIVSYSAIEGSFAKVSDEVKSIEV